MEFLGITPRKRVTAASPRMAQELGGGGTRSEVSPCNIIGPESGFAGRDRTGEEDKLPRPGNEGSSDYEPVGHDLRRARGAPSLQDQGSSEQGG